MQNIHKLRIKKKITFRNHISSIYFSCLTLFEKIFHPLFLRDAFYQNQGNQVKKKKIFNKIQLFNFKIKRQENIFQFAFLCIFAQRYQPIFLDLNVGI